MTDLATTEAAGAALSETDESTARLHRNLFIEANPIAVKWAMARMGLCGHAIRLPMTELAPEHQPAVEAAMKACGLI